ncbi:MAG: DNA alkylation repair protein [Rhodobacteraceae bacterium]|nr:DNA alkylation repair protein [Paracoccaceae bacterium]
MTALEQLQALADAEKSVEMAAYHKASREYLGVSNPQIDALVKEWRAAMDVAQRVALADQLWQSNLHEARIAATKLLIQARIKPDDQPAWDLIKSWVPDFDAWAIADHASSAGSRRLVADSTRLDDVAQWAKSDHMWSRRAALVMTLPWAKLNYPSEKQNLERERILGWAADYAVDSEWFIQKSIGWWIRDLSKHDPDRARQFLENHSETMAAFAAKIAGKYLS